MNRAERRKKDREFQKNKKIINNLTPAQTKVVAMLVEERATMLSNAYMNNFTNLIDENLSAVLFQRGLETKEIKKIQNELADLMLEDVRKRKELEKENVNVMKIQEDVKQAVGELLERGVNKKEALKDLAFKFPKLSKSMLSNAYMNVKEERQITREKIVESAKKFGLDTEGKKKIAKELGATLSTISTYISRWKITEEEIKSEKETEKALEYIFTDKPKTNPVAPASVVAKNVTTEERVIKENLTTNHIADVGNMIEEEKMKGLKILEEKVVKSIKAEGKNGEYEATTGKGVFLKNKGQTLFFSNVKELEEFTEEFKKIFKMVE
ncbi:hypothetical protein [Clostridium cochlearium]|uniref:hypothetical protein n=1 Tax=Clostridium cochlearium TaxID=1494 RepID=UPI000BBC917E|nr:hypothetical protein [Clostridium cochlearium]